MAKTNYNKAGLTKEQWKDRSDTWNGAQYADVARKGFPCPVCGRRTNGRRPEGYMHRGRYRGDETTYCKIKEGKHE